MTLVGSFIIDFVFAAVKRPNDAWGLLNNFGWWAANKFLMCTTHLPLKKWWMVRLSPTSASSSHFDAPHISSAHLHSKEAFATCPTQVSLQDTHLLVHVRTPTYWLKSCVKEIWFTYLRCKSPTTQHNCMHAQLFTVPLSVLLVEEVETRLTDGSDTTTTCTFSLALSSPSFLETIYTWSRRETNSMIFHFVTRKYCADKNILFDSCNNIIWNQILCKC